MPRPGVWDVNEARNYGMVELAPNTSVCLYQKQYEIAMNKIKFNEKTQSRDGTPAARYLLSTFYSKSELVNATIRNTDSDCNVYQGYVPLNKSIIYAIEGNTSSQGAKPVSIEVDADDSAPSLDENDVQQGLTAFEQIIGKREGESEEMSLQSMSMSSFSSTPFPTGCFPSKADTQTYISELETSQTGRPSDSRAPVQFGPKPGHKQHAMLPDKSSTKGKPTTAKKTPLQAPSFLCELCMASFYSENDLCIHKRSVNHKGLYYCRWCASSFRTKEERNKHVRCHVDGSMFVELCIPCGKGFKSRMGYNNHMKMYHTKEGEVQTFRCEVCGKSCVTKSQLNVHMKAHSDEQNFYCVTCNKSFKHKFTLQRHNCTVSQL